MPDIFPCFQAAVVQASPTPFDRAAGIKRIASLINEVAAQGSRFALFPEALVPAYPWGLRFGTRIGGRTPAGREMFTRYWANSIEVPGPDTDRLARAARDAKIHVAVGVVERDTSTSRGTLFCTLLYFGPDGTLLGKHRKLKPTAGERYLWGEGDGSTLPVLETDIGRIGGLICWENYMPLARTAMYAKGVQIYLAPTADARDTWLATMRHVACEGRCFVLSCNQYVRRDHYPSELETSDELQDTPEVLCRGGSCIIGPLGEVLAGPLYGSEGILTAEIDLARLPGAKFDFDVVGHYARPDIFRLSVNEEPAPGVVREDRQFPGTTSSPRPPTRKRR